MAWAIDEPLATCTRVFSSQVFSAATLHRVNPEAYLTDVLTKLVNNWPNSRLAELTPWTWAAQHR